MTNVYKHQITKEGYLKNCGRYFRYMRREFDYTQKEFAEKCGVRQQTISDFERGVSISGYSVLKILSYLNQLVIEHDQKTRCRVNLRDITFKR